MRIPLLEESLFVLASNPIKLREDVMAKDLIFVTGGSSGIGQGLIEARTDRDAQVFNLSRRPGPESNHVSVDLATPAGWDFAEKTFSKEISKFHGERVLLIHSAGSLSPIGFSGEKNSDDYRRNILLNSAAPQILADAFLRALASFSGRGVLLFIGSGASRTAYAGWSGYCGGKAAVDQWVRSVGIELKARGDRCKVLCVAPGIVETDMQAEIRNTSDHDFPEVGMFISLYNEGGLKTPSEVSGQIWEMLDSNEFDNGEIFDLRDLS